MKLLPSNWAGHKRLKGFLPAIVLLALLAACSPAKKSPGVLERQGWVSDYAGKLAAEDRTRIAAVLQSYEEETCHQVYLLIVPNLKGENILEFSQRHGTAWDIGQPGFGNGFLVTVAMEEGAVRIETGSSFEWFIENGSGERVLKEVMFPLFRENKFVAGLELGLAEIMAAGRLKPIPENHRPAVCRRQQ
jgi:uncharacterized protein